MHSNDEYDDELIEIMAAYRRQQLIEHLIGPVISLALHVLLFIGMIIFLAFPNKRAKNVAEITHHNEVEEQVIPPPPLEELTEEQIEDAELNPSTATPLVTPDSSAEDSSTEDNSDDAAESADELPNETFMQEKAFDSVIASPILGGRTASGRRQMNNKHGGDKTTLNAAIKALLYLKKKQNQDGSWGSNSGQAKSYRMNFTALCTLFFLAHGETPESKNFGKTVLKSLKYLSKHKFKKRGGPHYETGLVTYALAEAYAITQAPSLKEAMDRGIETCISRQLEDGSFTDYQVPDLSAAGWYIQALKAATMAGCTHPQLEEAKNRSIKFIKKSAWLNKGRVQSFYYNYQNKKKGAAIESYNQKKYGHLSDIGMRAVGSLALVMLGEKNSKEVRDVLKIISNHDIKYLKWITGKEQPLGFPLYTWYYQTQAMFLKSGTSWNKWNKVFKRVITKSQRKKGYWDYPAIGGWFNNRGFSNEDKRIYSTAMCGLMLTVYYRYLPTNIKRDLARKGQENNRDFISTQDLQGLIIESIDPS